MKIKLLMARTEAENISKIDGVDECDGSDIAPESIVALCGDEADQVIERLRQIKTVLETRILRFLVSWEGLLLLKQMGLVDHSTTPLPESSEYVAAISVDPVDPIINTVVKTIIVDQSTVEYSPETAFEATMANPHIPSKVKPAELSSVEEDTNTEATENSLEERIPLGEVNGKQLNTKSKLICRSFYLYKWDVGKIIGYKGDRITFIRKHTNANVKVKPRNSGPKASIRVTGYPKQVDAAIELMTHYLATN
ncbi:hypothetical protein TRICI_001823 [Trichomonascus ciferrii]|uniref:K Homology domain-containing protein n=1 Tax=Trichomonascus ciferrii TaxID=44093 RepID=A0A642V847_9ASCO|nr:hypothetical protein TRICI_001823 [Trichomonascus ciferrii]